MESQIGEKGQKSRTSTKDAKTYDVSPFSEWSLSEWSFAFTSSHINSTELIHSICKVGIESLSMILYYHKNKYINVYTLKFCIIFFYLSYDKCKSQSIQKFSLTCFLLVNAFHWITYSIKCCLNY